MQRRYRRYDHRIKNMIAESGDPYLFPDLAIPLSTAREWIKRGPQDVVTLWEIGQNEKNLLGEIQSLKKELNTLKVEQDLSIKTFRLFGFQIQYQRLPSEESKISLLQMVHDAVRTIGLERALETIGLSRARWSLWLRRSKNCQLADESSCPKTLPQRLTSPEVRTIKELVTDPELRHFSISSLSLYAKRIGKVFASVKWHSMLARKPCYFAR